MKMNKLLILLALFFWPLSFYAQPLSPNAKASLLTVEPGAELYSSFGHNALRIYDPFRGIDRIYNYGTFDFRADNFYVKFLRGTLPYYVSVQSMPNTVYGAMAENRTIREQTLNLTPTQCQRLFDLLETNALPENREYRYKFYYDNCASRPRDMLVKACGDSLRFVSAVDTTRSYRDWMNDYLTRQLWARMGMNLAIGRPADETASAWESMYLPDNVHAEVAQAQLKTADGRTVPLITSDSVLFQSSPQGKELSTTALLTSPNVVFFVLFALVFWVTRRQHQQGQRGFGLDRWLFGFTGVWGWFLFLLWVATDHGVPAWNPALLFMMPLHLPLIFWVTRQKDNGLIRNYFLLTAIGLVVFFLYSAAFHYVYGYFFYLLTLLIRAVHHIRFTRTAVGRSAQAAL